MASSTHSSSSMSVSIWSSLSRSASLPLSVLLLCGYLLFVAVIVSGSAAGGEFKVQDPFTVELRFVKGDFKVDGADTLRWDTRKDLTQFPWLGTWPIRSITISSNGMPLGNRVLNMPSHSLYVLQTQQIPDPSTSGAAPFRLGNLARKQQDVVLTPQQGETVSLVFKSADVGGLAEYQLPDGYSLWFEFVGAAGRAPRRLLEERK